jgi:hypothetical protein
MYMHVDMHVHVHMYSTFVHVGIHVKKMCALEILETPYTYHHMYYHIR